MKKLIHSAVYALVLLLTTVGRSDEAGTIAATAPAPAPPPLWRTVYEASRVRVNVLGYGVSQKPVDSLLNPDNVAEIWHRRAALDVRPDLAWTWRWLDLSVKPRFLGEWKAWNEGPLSGDDELESEVFVHEWHARVMIQPELFISYGRENLQWGPSWLLSPSNPFNADNGRQNPKLETPALDYARLVWLPHYEWTVSLIGNTDEGRLENVDDFHRAVAAKLDYTGDRKYATLIGAVREEERSQLGFYAGVNASESLLVYLESSVAGDERPRMLVGGSYTMAMGPTLSVEYFHNADGYDNRPIHECYPPFGDAEPGDVLVRKNYLLLQYMHTNLLDALDLTIRAVLNLDDRSTRYAGILEYDIGTRLELFGVGTLNMGDADTEFGALLEHSVMIGARVSL